MNTEQRIALLVQLGEYMLSDSEEWDITKDRAVSMNAWFTRGNVELAVSNICAEFLQKDKLEQWISKYTPVSNPKTVGIVTAGNIPLVGFHDFLSCFMSGHITKLKLSSKDEVLLKHIIAKLTEWNSEVANEVIVADNLKNCDAYIATGSNNTARYFEQYFAKYPNIIRKNRTSVAILDGTETAEELDKLMNDVFSYYGLGCRNVTQICVPKGYDLTKIMEAANNYADIINHHKYKNNFDYYLAIYLLNKVPYYSNDSLLMVENAVPFSAVGVLHYRYYDSIDTIQNELNSSEDIQCIVGHNNVPFGNSQKPNLADYADGVDTMQFLTSL
ncbi:MAG: acyl-CoA reductase [Chitinophagales bacterium]|nr:acyl-CoA reductase [Chitinophagales bacterium]